MHHDNLYLPRPSQTGDQPVQVVGLFFLFIIHAPQRTTAVSLL